MPRLGIGALCAPCNSQLTGEAKYRRPALKLTPADKPGHQRDKKLWTNRSGPSANPYSQSARSVSNIRSITLYGRRSRHCELSPIRAGGCSSTDSSRAGQTGKHPGRVAFGQFPGLPPGRHLGALEFLASDTEGVAIRFSDAGPESSHLRCIRSRRISHRQT